jgi:carboxymethylenebutenolidase
MCDDDIHQYNEPAAEGSQVSRRTFALSAAAIAAMSAAPAFAAEDVVEKDVTVKTPDGMADAVLFHPAKGKHPAVLIWTDVFGLRPAFRDMGRRLAAQGYTVLVPNPFYRSMKATTEPDYSAPDIRKKYFPMMATLTYETTVKDGPAFLAFLDAQPQTDTKKKAGVQGYCMGGPLTFRTAAAVPGRVGGAATFHGAALVSDSPQSPHLLIPTTTAQFYCGVAANDDKAQPDAKDKLKAAFAAVHRPATVEVYDGCNHGWCVKGSAVYNEAGAEKAWAELSALYKRTLV